MSSLALTETTVAAPPSHAEGPSPVQRVIVIHQVAWCPRVRNWGPCVVTTAYFLALAMLAACFLSAANFGQWDDLYYLRSGQYTWWGIRTSCPDMPDAPYVALRRNIHWDDAKAACSFSDDTRVCYSVSKGCVKAVDITWIWSLSLALFLSVWLMTCVVFFVFFARPNHLSDASLKVCGLRHRARQDQEDAV